MEKSKTNQDLMYLELKRVNYVMYKSFKKCVKNLNNKVLGKNEKTCIKEYLDKEKAFQEELLQSLSKINARRVEEEISLIKGGFK